MEPANTSTPSTMSAACRAGLPFVTWSDARSTWLITRSSARSAQVNSSASSPKPKMINAQPGPGVNSMITPSSRTTVPARANGTRMARLRWRWRSWRARTRSISGGRRSPVSSWPTPEDYAWVTGRL